jgi:predicted  nucleic acid-binding Zn-ribbon protein
MASPSVSFRISRSAEDLAGTLHLLSQRLVRLEQRLEALEGQRQASQQEDPGLEESLGNAERLLLDCRALLGGALDPIEGSGDRDAVRTEFQKDRELDGEPAFEFEVPKHQARAVDADDAETEIPLFSNGPVNSAAA